jgi:peptidoglycan DL-endopeptidase LytE
LIDRIITTVLLRESGRRAADPLPPIGTRRPRRRRRSSWNLNSTFSFGAIVGLTVAIVAVVSRLISPAPAAMPMAEAAEPIAYSPDTLRPDLDEPDVSVVPIPVNYAVEEGDTLLAISFKFGTSVEAIRLASNLRDRDMLSIGQQLVIPPARSVLQSVDPFITVREVAQVVQAEPETVARYNGVALENLDEPVRRTTLVLPPDPLEAPTRQIASARGNPPEARSASSPPASSAPSASSAVSNDANLYTIEEGDTILAIADKLGVDAEALAAMNRLSDSNIIVVGGQLKVNVWDREAADEAPVAVAEGDGVVRAASLPATITRPTRPQTPIVYEVSEGDTVGTLAERFGVDTATIVVANDLGNADRLKVGDQLTILPVTGVQYTVQPGDTLAEIAERYQVDLGPIIDFNYLDDVDVISVGKDIILPGAKPLPPAPPKPTGPVFYTVQAGDNVGSIARKFGVTSADVVAANGLHNADRLTVGDSLKIVPGAGDLTPAPAPAASAPGRTATPPKPASQQQVTVNLPLPAAPAPAARPSNPGAGSGIVGFAMNYLGHRYVFGGTTPAGFDCSGFVYYVMNNTGHPMSRGMWGQYGAGSHPGRGELQPGDIVFFQNTYMAGLSHNGIYIGNGQFIHASDERSGVKISGLNESYWSAHWFGATRP